MLARFAKFDNEGALIARKFDKHYLLYASFTSKYIHYLARQITKQYRLFFTIQTTTRFDASSPRVPHFAVIDMTVDGWKNYQAFYGSSNKELQDLHQFQKHVFQNCLAVFAMGNYVKQSLVQDFQIQCNSAITIGAGPNVSVGPAPKVTNSQTILFVGSHWERKGGPLLVEAFKIVYEKHPDATLQIIGCNPGIDIPGIDVVGKVARHKLHHYFSHARVFVLPTQLEAFGIVFVEALHFGLPIIATNIGAIPDMVKHGNNGLLIDIGDLDALVQALDQVLSNDSLALKMRKAALEKAQKFDWDHAASIIDQHVHESITQAYQNKRYESYCMKNSA